MILMSLFGVSFEVPVVVYLIVPVVLLFLLLNRGVLRKKTLFVAVRCIVIALIMFVLATPYMAKQESIKKETTSVMVIDDRSGSMSLYQSDLAQTAFDRIKSAIGSFSSIELKNLSESNRTALGEAVYQSVLGSAMKSNAIVMATDGNNNYGPDPADVAAFAASAKTKIFAITPNLIGNEIFVKDIVGTDKSPVNSEYLGSVVIGMAGGQASYSLTITVDGINALETPVVQNTPEKEFTFEKIFNQEGPHNITATILPQSTDTFSQNNVFNKVVNVIERPRILLVASNQSSPLEQVLKEVYDVDVATHMPADISYYSAVVIDDEPASAVGDITDLRDFLNDGGGLVVVGGNKSYENGGYYESNLENLLPVKSSEAPSKKGQQVNVIIVIDISGSTGNMMTGSTKIDVEKAIAVKMIRDLGQKNNIGVIAFNTDAFLIQGLRKLPDTASLEEKMSRLKFGGGTYVVSGLKRAHEMLSSVQGSNYVVLISDGVTNYPVQAFTEAKNMVEEGIVIHTVGVGFDTDTSFMQGLATQGGGMYFASSETDRVKIIIGNPEEEETTGGFSVSITNTHHFITEGLQITNISIKDFDRVTAKSSAQVLAATAGLQPILSVWRFGLGRVASLTVDDGGDWAKKLYGEGNSRLISSTVNWAIGDPEREKSLNIGCVDTQVGEETPIMVTSEKSYPEVKVDGKTVGLNRLSEKGYYFTYKATATGFVSISSSGYSCRIAINYPKEYDEFGINLGLLSAMAEATGGEVFKSDEIESLVAAVSDYTTIESTGTEVKKIDLQQWFALGALLVFFADIVARRVREIRRGRAEKI